MRRRPRLPSRAVAAAAAATMSLVAMPCAAPAMPMGGDGRSFSASISGAGFNPTKLTVLTGDSVTWNDTGGSHTVTSDSGAFASTTLGYGDMFTHRFSASGTFHYYCSIHRYMTGEVDVADILVDSVPVGAAPGRPLPLRGRAALPGGSEVTVEGDTGAGFTPVTTASVGTDGSFVATVTPQTTTTYRVISGEMTSSPVLVRALDRKVTVVAVPQKRSVRLRVTVTPASPGATVVLQYNLRERFGWWPIAQTRLDRSSRATFTVRPPHRVSARVLLTLPDGATELAASPGLTLRP